MKISTISLTTHTTQTTTTTTSTLKTIPLHSRLIVTDDIVLDACADLFNCVLPLATTVLIRTSSFLPNVPFYELATNFFQISVLLLCVFNCASPTEQASFIT